MLKNVELKKFKEIEGHGDSRTFNAEICVDGKKLGVVMNNGWGGPNEYRFTDNDSETLFRSKVAEWKDQVIKTGENWIGTMEVDDSFIEALINEIGLLKTKAKFLKKGFPISLLCKSGKTFPFKDVDHMKDCFEWGKEWVVGFKFKGEAALYVKKEKVEFSREI